MNDVVDAEGNAPLAASFRNRAHFGPRFVMPLALGSTLNPINSTMISTALVPIAADFHASVANAGWLIAGLYLASAVAQPAMGRLADIFGPRRVYLVSLFLVAIAGIFGQLAPSLPMLVAVRVLLGIGTSGAYPSAMRIFRMEADRLGLEPPRAAMSILSLAAQATIAVGPLMGGVLTGAFGWHAIFTVNVPLAAVAVLLVLLWIPRDPPVSYGFTRLVKELDLTGIVLFAACLLALMTFVMNLQHPIWWALGTAVLLGGVLIVYSAHCTDPFIDVRMLAHNSPLRRTYLRAGAQATIVYCVVYGFAQWLESGAGFTPSAAGLIMLPISIVAAFSSLIGGKTKGIRGPFIVSGVFALLGCFALLGVGSGTSAWIITAAIMLFGLPQGMFSTATQAAVYIQSPASEIGVAAGFQRTAQYIGAILSASLLGLLYGQRASDGGFHHLAIVMGVLSAILLAATIVDRTIPRGRVG